MSRNRGVGREGKGSATSGSISRLLEDRGAHAGKEETEMVGRDNASCRDVESAGTLLQAAVGVLVQEHRGARNGWASVWHSFAALGASEHRTVARGGRALVFSHGAKHDIISS